MSEWVGGWVGQIVKGLVSLTEWVSGTMGE